MIEHRCQGERALWELLESASLTVIEAEDRSLMERCRVSVSEALEMLLSILPARS